LDYPEEIRSSIYTINILERANKEIKRRTKTIEVFSYVKAIEKILYLIPTELNEKWSRGVHRGFIKAKPILEKIRRKDFPRIFKKKISVIEVCEFIVTIFDFLKNDPR